MSPWAYEDFKLGGGAVNFLPELSRRSGEQSEKLSEFPFALSDKLPNETVFCPTEMATAFLPSSTSKLVNKS